MIPAISMGTPRRNDAVDSLETMCGAADGNSRYTPSLCLRVSPQYQCWKAVQWV